MMKTPNSLFAALLLMTGSLGLVGGLSAAEKSTTLTMEQRLERLERILRNQSLSDIILQLQQLQQEVQQLRGEVELQNHTMDALNKRQRDLYIDIDQRLSRMQPGAAASSPSPATAATASQPTKPDAMTPAPQPAPVQAATRSQPPDPKQETAAYQKAFNLLKQGRYQESISAFRDFLENYPGGKYEDNAQYWLGEASYVNRDFDTALIEFSKVVERYPTSSKVPGALLKSGYIHYEKHNWSQARELFQRLQKEYAGGTEARLAVKRLERMDKEGH